MSAAPALALAPERPETKAASVVTATTATLNGVLNPSAEATAGYDFTYQQSETECNAGQSTEPAAEETGEALKVSAQVSGLEPSKRYTFCMVATHREGESTESTPGVPVTFETKAAKPSVTVGAVSAVSSSGATLEAQINPNNQTTMYTFEYSTQETGGTLEGTIVKVNGASSLEGFGDQPASAPTGHLEGSTTYYYRVVAKDATGSTANAVRSFATVPIANTDGATAITANTATLNGHFVLNPTINTDYAFNYRLGELAEGCAGESSTTPTEALSATVSSEISGLVADRTYTACVVTSNTFGSEQGPAIAFKTLEAVKPTIEAQSAGEATKDSVAISGTINPGGATTTCGVKIGTPIEGLKAVPVPCPTTLDGVTAQTTSVSLRGLAPDTEYEYQFIASNEKGKTTASGVAKFTTHQLIVLTTEPASRVKRANAVINGHINPEGVPSNYYYEYGLEPCNSGTATCGTETPTRGPVSDEGPAEAFKLTRLKPGATYHYWIVASNAEGTVHGLEETFTTETAEPKEYRSGEVLEGSWRAVGVNQETQDLYAYDGSAIKQFDAGGVLQSSIEIAASGFTAPQLAVDNACYYQKLSALECGVQFPSNGDVYMSDESKNLVYKLDPNAKGELALDTTIGEGVVDEPDGVAVDTSGNVYVASFATSSVAEFSATGALVNADLISGVSAPEAVAVDKAGNIFVAAGSGTSEYRPNGECAEPSPSFSGECEKLNTAGDKGVAIDAAGDVFVSQYEGPARVAEYAPTVGHPPIENALLEGSGTFAGHPSGLAVNDTNGSLYVVESGIKVFDEVEAKPVGATTEPATQVGATAEALEGTVNPGGMEPAEYYFEYGANPCDAAAETCGTVASEPSEVPLNGDEAIPVSVHVDNLAPNTTYHYWIVGVNEESGVDHGEEQTFTTGSPVAPPPSGGVELKTPTGEEPGALAPFPVLSGLAPTPEPKSTVKPKATPKPKVCKKGFEKKHGKCVRTPKKKMKRR